MAGLGTPYFGVTWLYLTYGVIGGFGVGMGYITPVAVVTKWFAHRRGLGSCMVLMGSGLGTFFYSLLVKSIPSFNAAVDAAAEYAAAHRLDAQVPPLALHHTQAVTDVCSSWRAA